MRCKVDSPKNYKKEIIMMQKMKYGPKRNSSPYTIIHKKRKALVTVISNKHCLSCRFLTFR